MAGRPVSRDDRPVKGAAAEAPTTWAWAAVVVGLVDTIAVVAVAVVSLSTGTGLDLAADAAWILPVAAVSFPFLAALVLRTRGRGTQRPPRQDRLAWALLGVGALAAVTVVVRFATRYGLDQGLAHVGWLLWLSLWLWAGVSTGLLLVVLWFPTGEAPSPRWRWVEWGIGGAYLAIAVSSALTPGDTSDYPGHDNPLGWVAARDALAVLSTAGFVLLAVVAVGTVAAVARRFQQGAPEVRRQLRWLVLGVGFLVLTVLAPWPSSMAGLAEALTVLATALLPVTLAVTLLRRDGFVLPGVLVYGALSAVLLATYLLVVGAAQAVFGSSSDRVAGLVAAAVVALLLAPTRSWLQRGVGRLVYGDRGDPYAALSALGRRLALSPEGLLDEVVHAVSDAERSPYVAVTLGEDPVPAAAAGRPVARSVDLPLLLGGVSVGRLTIGARADGEPLARRDLDLLEALSHHVAVAAHAAALTRDLQRSREALVLAREEERRRIRRDLHDGLGPALAGIAFGIDAARRTLARSPARADADLGQLTVEVQSAVDDVRRLVHDLRPPTLDQLGLVPALDEYAARLSERATISVRVFGPDLPPLPAAVEVAAYRIATEALSNAARHARAHDAAVHVSVDPCGLRLEVLDDGVGLRASPRGGPDGGGGMGLAAMAERAAELGGTFEALLRPGGGTAVVAVIPVARSS